MPPEDRDRLKVKTPPAGVRAQTARPESFEEDTPVEGDPISQMTTRAKNAANNSRAAFGAIGDLRRQLTAAVERDVADHDRLYDSVNRVDRKVDEIGSVQKELLRDMGELRENVGETRGIMQQLVTQLEADREERMEAAKARAIIELEEKKAELEVKKVGALSEIKVEETAKVTQIADEADSRKVRRKRSLKVIGGAIAVITALSTVLGALQC